MFELNTCLQKGALWLVSFCSAIAYGYMLLKGTVLQHLASSPHSSPATLCCSKPLSRWKYICRFWTTAAGFLFCWFSRSLMKLPKTRVAVPSVSHGASCSLQHCQLNLSFLGNGIHHLQLEQGCAMLSFWGRECLFVLQVLSGASFLIKWQ